MGQARCGRSAAAGAGPDGSPAVLLQHRAPWSHQGGTWGLPGGARDSHETAEQAAVREAHEEAGLPADQLTVRTTVVTAEISGAAAPLDLHDRHRRRPRMLQTMPNRESAELRWVALDDVADLPLHPGFAASWERLLDRDGVDPSAGQPAALSRLQPRAAARVVGRGDRAHDDDSASSRRKHLGQPLLVDAADREPWFVRCHFGGGADQVEAGRRPAGFGRGGPARADAEVVDLLGGRSARLCRGRAWTGRSAGRGPMMSRAIGSGRSSWPRCSTSAPAAQRDVGAVVDRQQRAVAACRVGEHLQCLQLLACLQRTEPLLTRRALVPQLDDVNPARQRRVGEFREVTSLAAGVGAQIQRRRGQPFTGCVHPATLCDFCQRPRATPGPPGRIGRACMFIAVLGAILGLVHIYLWKRLVKDTTRPGRTRWILTALLVALAAVLLAALILPRVVGLTDSGWYAWPGYLWLGLAAYLFLSLLILEPVRLALRGWVNRKPPETKAESASLPVLNRRVFLASASAVAAGAASVGLVGIGAATALGPPDLLHVPVRLRRLDPAFHGFRIALVSDIHLGPLAGRAHTERIVGMINETAPDLVAIVGDLVDGTVEELGSAAEPLRDLHSREGTFFVTGNHEYFVEDTLSWLARTGAARCAAAAQREHRDSAWRRRVRPRRGQRRRGRVSTRIRRTSTAPCPGWIRPGRRSCSPTNRFR